MPATTTTSTTQSGINSTTVKSLGGVLLAGSVGGFLFWIIAKWTGTSLPTVFGQGTIAILMFVGALAGAFGVYLLTASDLNAIRTYIFAIICGLAWQPIIGAAQRMATNAAATSQNAQVGNQVALIKSAATNGSTQQISSAVENAAPAVNQALSLSTSVSDASKKAEITEQSKQAIDQVQTTSNKAPNAAVDFLKSVSLSAANSGESSVGIHAVQALQMIGKEQSQNPAVTLKVQQSLNDLASQSRDPSIQTAARTAASEMIR